MASATSQIDGRATAIPRAINSHINTVEISIGVSSMNRL
jgi:hypothetical protein